MGERKGLVQQRLETVHKDIMVRIQPLRNDLPNTPGVDDVAAGMGAGQQDAPPLMLAVS